MTWGDLWRDALLEIAVIDPLDPVPPEMLDLALLRTNGILNQWNATQEATYNVTFPTFTLTPLLSPHTIGPTGTFTATSRPVAIIGANLQVGTGTNLVNLPIEVVDDAWWLAQPVPNIQSGIPTQLYYSPDWPNGSLYFWPVPSVAYGVQLETRQVLAEVTSADYSTDFSMPPGYQRALTLTLAEDLTGPLPVQLSPKLVQKAAEARAIVFANNNAPVRIRTRQSGMMAGRTMNGAFNWRSRTSTGSGR